MNSTLALQTLLAIAVIALIAPLITGFLPWVRIPQVVLLLIGGMVIGPQGLGFGHPKTIESMSDVGLGFVFLLAGYEVDTKLFKQDPGRRAMVSWFSSVVLGGGIVAVLASFGLVRAYVPVALGLTTTALGALLPILRENGLLHGRFGRYLLAAGAVGELFPILAIALFLGVSNRFTALLSLAVVGVAAVILSQISRVLRPDSRLSRVLTENQDETSQITLRATVVLLVLLVVLTDRVHLDAILGAFLAGMVLRRWAKASAPALEDKLDVIGYGFFIPIFFVYSGMTLDLHAILEAPLRLLLFFCLMLAARGVPALLIYRRVLTLRQRAQMMLINATALPLLVALSEIGLRNGTMLPENAAALVGAGVLSVLVFPAVAVLLNRTPATDDAAQMATRDPAQPEEVDPKLAGSAEG